jgi:hypothetical protein
VSNSYKKDPIMRKILLAIGVFSMVILGCTNEKVDNSLNGSWTVLSFENLTTGATEFKTQENSWDKDIKVQFHDTNNPNIISGTNITNQISGEFNYVGQNQFAVSNLASTYVGQPRWADEFVVAILDQDLTFKIADDKLVIYYDNNSKSVTLTRD